MILGGTASLEGALICTVRSPAEAADQGPFVAPCGGPSGQCAVVDPC